MRMFLCGHVAQWLGGPLTTVSHTMASLLILITCLKTDQYLTLSLHLVLD